MDWSSLVGIPFVERGRDASGCDCWGLVRLAYRLGTGVELPSYAEDYAHLADRAEITRLVETGKSAWQPVEPGHERRFDCVLMVIRSMQHIGIVTGPGRMLHMPRDSFSVIEPYDGHYSAAVKRGGFFRYEAA